ncbi:MAG: SUMF1/EgtB/PvdO family nonheme iron enzyme [Verrucomicrobiales bacterium]|nr:SUMF1/EgtB/PvdO family nonheme iron enzyme [Verrucomicrobiales bacterium]
MVRRQEWGARLDAFGGRPVEALPNAFAACTDMHGNVWEWCHDRWREFAYRDCTDGAPDPGDEERRHGLAVRMGQR